jgi:uncharacterized protein (TIGR02246 family)
MTNLRKFFFVVCLIAALNNISASALDEFDRNTIQTVIQGFADSWNLRQGKGLADGFTDDADFVNIYGMVFSGRATIEERHLKILQTFLKGTHMAITDIQLREAQPGVVIALVRWKVDGYHDPGTDLSLPGVMREGIFTEVFIKENNNWKITAAQNTLITATK